MKAISKPPAAIWASSAVPMPSSSAALRMSENISAEPKNTTIVHITVFRSTEDTLVSGPR